MLKKLALFAATVALLVGNVSHGAEPETTTFRGVMTYYLTTARVMRINESLKTLILAPVIWVNNKYS